MGDQEGQDLTTTATRGGQKTTSIVVSQRAGGRTVRSRSEITVSTRRGQYGSIGGASGDPCPPTSSSSSSSSTFTTTSSTAAASEHQEPFYKSNLSFGTGTTTAKSTTSIIAGRVFGTAFKDVEGGGGVRTPLLEDRGKDVGPALKQLLGMRRSSLLLLTYVAFYVTFLAMGGIVFSALEGPGEDRLVETLLSARMRFLQEHPCVTDDALEELIREVMEASKRGVSAARNVTGEPNWSFGQSLFFSSTVITTIGYGHVTPLSKGGKIFCMVYATLGIPLTLVLLTALVERLTSGPSSGLLRAINSRLGHLYPPFTLRLLHLTLLLVILAPLLFFVPAGIFSKLEPTWDYLDALYYCFISLTTIGLGDYVPGDNPDQPYRPLYKVATTIYLLVGLTLMMLALTVFYDIPQLNFGLFFLPRSDEAQTGHSGVPGGLLSSVSSGIGDSEKARLRTPGALPGPKYTQQLDHCGGSSGMGGGKRRQHQVVRVKSRARDDDDDEEEEENGGKRHDADDSPSPGEDTTPVHAQRP